jgi:hypothetical protein
MKIFDFEMQRWSIVQRTGECNFPTWSSDSQFIYFVLPWDDPGVFRVGSQAPDFVDLSVSNGDTALGPIDLPL